MQKPVAWALALGLVCLSAKPALGDEVEACLASYDSAQRLRAQSKLLEAREALQKCSRPECPGVARVDCAKWLEEVRGELPSIVIVATDAAGNDLTEVRLLVDGAVVVEKLTGQGVELDPGPHTLRFEREGAEAVERKIVLRVGEHNRRIPVTLALATVAPPPPPPPPKEEPPAVPTATWVLGGIGVVGLASFGYFALDGTSRQSDLESCKPNCPDGDVSATKRSYLLADISLAVGAISLGGAAYFYFTRPVPATAGRLSLGAGATPGGGWAVLRGAF